MFKWIIVIMMTTVGLILSARQCVSQELTKYLVRVTNIVDGDTFDGIIYLGFGVMKSERFRLFGIDTWEPRGDTKAKGDKATRALKNWIGDKMIVVEVEEKTKNDIVYAKRGKYGRPLCIIHVDDININLWFQTRGTEHLKKD